MNLTWATQTIRQEGLAFILHSLPCGKSQFIGRGKNKANQREDRSKQILIQSKLIDQVIHKFLPPSCP